MFVNIFAIWWGLNGVEGFPLPTNVHDIVDPENCLLLALKPQCWIKFMYSLASSPLPPCVGDTLTACAPLYPESGYIIHICSRKIVSYLQLHLLISIHCLPHEASV